MHFHNVCHFHHMVHSERASANKNSSTRSESINARRIKTCFVSILEFIYDEHDYTEQCIHKSTECKHACVGVLFCQY